MCYLDADIFLKQGTKNSSIEIEILHAYNIIMIPNWYVLPHLKMIGTWRLERTYFEIICYLIKCLKNLTKKILIVMLLDFLYWHY